MKLPPLSPRVLTQPMIDQITTLITQGGDARNEQVTGVLKEVYYSAAGDWSILGGTLVATDGQRHTVIIAGRTTYDLIRPIFQDDHVIRATVRYGETDPTLKEIVAFDDLGGPLRERALAPVGVDRFDHVMNADDLRGTTASGTLDDPYCATIYGTPILAARLVTMDSRGDEYRRLVWVRGECLERIRPLFRNGKALTLVLRYAASDPSLFEIVDFADPDAIATGEITPPDYAPGVSLVIMTPRMHPGHLVALVRESLHSPFFETSEDVARTNAMTMTRAARSVSQTETFTTGPAALRGRTIASASVRDQAMALATHLILADPDQQQELLGLGLSMLPSDPFVPFVLDPVSVTRLVDYVEYIEFALKSRQNADTSSEGKTSVEDETSASDEIRESARRVGKLLQASLDQHLGATAFLVER